jgi:hypothetical protein
MNDILSVEKEIVECLKSTIEPKEVLINFCNLDILTHTTELNEIKKILLDNTTKYLINSTNTNYDNIPKIDIYVDNKVKDPVLHTSVSSVITLLFKSYKEVAFIYKDIDEYYDNTWLEIKDVLKNVFTDIKNSIEKKNNNDT